MLLPSIPFEKSLAFYGVAELFQSRSTSDDETVNSFFQRRFGQEVHFILRFFTTGKILLHTNTVFTVRRYA